MKTGLQTRLAVFCLVIACMVIGAQTAAFAVPPKEVLQIRFNQTFTGLCCFSWNETVSVTEPAVLVPVVVTWATDFQNFNDTFSMGLSVNGGQCLAFGPRFLNEKSNDPRWFTTRTFEWVVLPSDVGSDGSHLHKGNNTFTVCGGGTTKTNAQITQGTNSLAVRLSP